MDFDAVLKLFNESGGNGVRLNGKPYPIRVGEGVVPYIKRVLGEHDAWKAGQEATTPGEAPASPVRAEPIGDTDGGRDVPVSDGSEEDVQGVEGSLEETLEAKVAALRGLVESFTRKTSEATLALRLLRRQKCEYQRELRLAERFLNEVSSSVRDETSEDLPTEEDGGHQRRDHVGESSSSDDSERGGEK